MQILQNYTQKELGLLFGSPRKASHRTRAVASRLRARFALDYTYPRIVHIYQSAQRIYLLVSLLDACAVAMIADIVKVYGVDGVFYVFYLVTLLNDVVMI